MTLHASPAAPTTFDVFGSGCGGKDHLDFTLPIVIVAVLFCCIILCCCKCCGCCCFGKKKNKVRDFNA